MKTLLIRGGKPLEGTVRISGGKNAALPVLAACVMCSRVCRISDCPKLTDVEAAVEILTHLGAVVYREGETLVVDPRPISRWEIPGEMMARMRGSFFFLGPLMARFGRCVLADPGGCPLGSRPVDYHMAGLRAMGAEFDRQADTLSCRGRLRGAEITLPYPSVGATENLIMAALGARGESVIRNAAREPEIVCLCDFLRRAGCAITGDGTDEIHIAPGLPEGGDFTLIPDRMEAATYLCAAASAGGRVELRGCTAGHLEAVTEVLKQMGCAIAPTENGMIIRARGLVSSGRIETGPYPAFPTDAQAPMMAALLRAKGETVLREQVFDRRMHHVPALRAMGGQIRLDGSCARITGTDRLFGAKVAATDLRGGAALVVAALAAENETEISGLEHLLRGYEDIAGKLRALGAEVSFG